MFEPTYLSLSQIISEIKSADPAKRKIAITVTGGGARGAYEAGAMEALISTLKSANIFPDVIVGTSAGAIVATTTFIDLLYPKTNTGTSIDLYNLRVSGIWRNLSTGNKGAGQVVDKKWLIEYATGQKTLPLQDLLKAGEGLGESFEIFKRDLVKIKEDFDNLGKIIKDYLTNSIKFDDTKRIIESLTTNIKSVLERIKTIDRYARYLANGDLSVIGPLFNEVKLLIQDVLRAIGDVARIIPAGILKDLFDSTISLINNFYSFAQRIGQALVTLGNDVGKIFGSGGEVIGDFAKFMAELTKTIATINLLLPFLGVIIVVGIGGAVLTDHILGNEPLAKLHDNFINECYKLSKSIPIGTIINGNEETIKDYVSRVKNQKVPELFLAGTNLSASRQIIFSLANSSTTEKLASFGRDRGLWVVDLTKQTLLRNDRINLFHPHDEMKNLLTTATITSTAIPMAFPPVKWKITHNTKTQGQQQTFSHVCVDGGVLDNTPIDIAAFVGATHIISIELTPLIDPLYDNTLNVTDKGYNLFTIAAASFFTSMDASLISRISSIVEQNNIKINLNNSKDVIQIYRIAPLINKTEYDPQRNKNKKASIGLVDFDGLYDYNDNNEIKLIMSIYDWFMQGYIDTIGLNLSNANNYPVFNDYMTNGKSIGCPFNYKIMGNKFWRATKQASPQENLVYSFLKKWIRCLYLDLLNREPDQGGFNYYIDLINRGTNKDSIVESFLRSVEYCTIVTNSLYQKYLERQSDTGGLQYYRNMLSTGTPIQNVIVFLCDSPEFKNKYPVPYEFTRALYNKILERPPEGGAVENTPLLSGVTTTTYIRGFLTSPEYASKLITSYYNKYLGRAPEPGAVEGGIPRLQNESLQQIIRGFLVSDEYQQRSFVR